MSTQEEAWRWVKKNTLLLLHDESLATHGGASGIRDEGLLDSALARAPNMATYATPDFADLAAAYAYGIGQNHPFVDGNKRAAFLSVGLFFFLNGYRLTANQVDATLMVLGLASGELNEQAFAAWLRLHSERL